MPDEAPHDFELALSRNAERRGSFGQPFVYFNEIGSTNDHAARLAEAGAPEGTTVAASSQTHGRGRLGRHWFSPPGTGLYVSVVVRERRAVPFVTLAGGVAIADGIRRATGLLVQIKWPNDIVVAGGPGRWRKVAGILAEAASNAGGLQYVVLGFGINLLPSAYPADIADRATSLAAELGRPVDAGAVLAECLGGLAQGVGELSAGLHAAVLGRWTTLAPSATGSRVECDGASGRVTGVTAGIDAQGALLVRTGDQLACVRSGEVRWL